MKLTNETKADVFFKAAMEELDLQYCECCGKNFVKQIRPVSSFTHEGNPFICDCIWIVVNNIFLGLEDTTNFVVQLKTEMNAFGMLKQGQGVWDHIPAEERQEARWFFLMLMVEYLDDADNE